MYFEIPQNQFFVPWKQEESKKRRNTLFQEVRESENTVKCYHKDKIPRAFTLRKKPGNLINIRNNTFKKSPPNSVLEEKAVLFPKLRDVSRRKTDAFIRIQTSYS